MLVDIFWLVVGGGGWWCIYFGWWWMVVSGGIVQPKPTPNISLNSQE